MIEVREEAV